MSDQLYLILDYETRSRVDLKKVGAYEYARHPSTEIICAAWRFGSRKTLRTARIETWCPLLEGSENPRPSFVHYSCDSKLTFIAHNAFFEQVISYFKLNTCPEVERWICTASMAAALALPRSLEGACEALKLPVQKDMDGRKLMLKYTKPRSVGQHAGNFWEDKADIKRLVEYCKKDVEAETELFLALPELTENERRVWCLDQEMNWRGFKADKKLIDNAIVLAEKEKSNLIKEMGKVTHGEVRSPSQRDATLAWLKSNGLELPNLRAKTVSDIISGTDNLSEPVKKVLKIRQAVSKSSTAKYKAFTERMDGKGIIRGSLVYHAASTGRWGGAGVQPQNLPKVTTQFVDDAVEMVKKQDLEGLRFFFGSPMEALSSCIRSCIIARSRQEFFCADYNAIEARVLFWVAEHERGLNVFRENRDPYKEMAKEIFSKPISEISDAERFLGKSAVLGCGYQMSWKKFRLTCEAHGHPISESLAQKAVGAYRRAHRPVVLLWEGLEAAAVKAVVSEKPVRYKKIVWEVKNNFLWCILPSGRKLAYYKPEIRYTNSYFEDNRAVLHHWGVNSTTKKWEISNTYGGKLTENVVQAVARDFMAEALLRLNTAGYTPILSIHDEILCEKEKGVGELKNFEDLMAEIPEWGVGCPIKVKGWRGDRYRK